MSPKRSTCARCPSRIALGQEPGERRADRLLPRAAEHRLGGSVEHHDALRPVDGDDRIHRGIEDAAQPRLAAREPRLRLHAVADVAQDEGEELALVLDMRREGSLDRKLGAVGAQRQHQLAFAHAHGCHAVLGEALEDSALLGTVPFRHQHVERSALDRAARPAKGRFGSRVEHQHALVFVGHDDGIHRRLHDLRQLGLGLLQVQARPLAPARLPVQLHHGQQPGQDDEDLRGDAEVGHMAGGGRGPQQEHDREGEQRHDRDQDDRHATGAPARRRSGTRSGPAGCGGAAIGGRAHRRGDRAPCSRDARRRPERPPAPDGASQGRQGGRKAQEL